MAVAIVTGGSQGLGRALSRALAAQGWSLIIDARSPADLAGAEIEVRHQLVPEATLVAVVGDVTDPTHRRQLIEAAASLGGLDLVVNNASTLGMSPLPRLVDHPIDVLRHVYEVNVVAPLALIADALPSLRRSPDPRVVNVTSDASVGAYEGWGGYGSSKAALDHISAVLAVEEPSLRVWAVDPGDMRTQMHQDAFAGEDISDRPSPDAVAPGFVTLIESALPSGRYRVSELVSTGEEHLS